MAMYDKFKPTDGEVEQKKYITLNCQNGAQKEPQDNKCAINKYSMCLINCQNEDREYPS